MKIIVLHGPGEIGKRSEVLKIKKQFSPENITQIDFKESGLKELEMQLVSPSLFDTSSRLVVVGNTPDSLDVQTLGGEEATTLLLISGAPKSDSAILQSSKKLGAKIIAFEGEKELTVFPFLDALIEKRKTAFIELEKLIGEYGSIYVLTMIYYLLRRNLLPLPSGDFMRKKIISQKGKYDPKDWIFMYRQTLEMEFKIKSGLTTERSGLACLVDKFSGEKSGE